MKTIQSMIEEIISRSTLYSEALSDGIANLTEMARRIQPEVEKRRMEKVAIETIAVALKRLQAKIEAPESSTNYLKKLENLTVRSGLVEFYFKTPEQSISLNEAIYGKAKKYTNQFVTISHGYTYTAVIVGKMLEKDVAQVLKEKNVKGVTKIPDLGSITIRLPEEHIFVAGVDYPILGLLAWHNINIIELISTASEFSMFFEDKDVDRAFSIIKSLPSRIT